MPPEYANMPSIGQLVTRLYKAICYNGKALSGDCNSSFSCSCAIDAKKYPDIGMMGLSARYILTQFSLSFDHALHSYAGGQQVFGLESVSRTPIPLFRLSTSANPNYPVPGSLWPLPLYQRTVCLSWPIPAALHPCSLEFPEAEIRGTPHVPSK